MRGVARWVPDRLEKGMNHKVGWPATAPGVAWGEGITRLDRRHPVGSLFDVDHVVDVGNPLTAGLNGGPFPSSIPFCFCIPAFAADHDRGAL
jgi:hypothetical protein